MDKTLERELLTVERMLTTQARVIEDEKAILSGRIKNYLHKHKTETLIDIFVGIYNLGREAQRYEFYENAKMNVMDKLSANERMLQIKK